MPLNVKSAARIELLIVRLCHKFDCLCEKIFFLDQYVILDTQTRWKGGKPYAKAAWLHGCSAG